jgi:hypothetical protein
VAFDPRVTLAGLGLTLSVAILFGLAPAWAVSRADAATALVGRVKRSLDSRFGRSLRSALVVGQLAASLVLVSGAGLLVRSFVVERNIPVGFEPAGLGWVKFSLPPRLVPNAAERVAIAEDCSVESPAGRRSLCYDRDALNERKQNKPRGSALEMAAEIGIELLTEEEYRALQQLGEFDTKTSSWVMTPPDVRSLGGALFCDRRYDKVFLYHNGAQSYYAARGFRGTLRV